MAERENAAARRGAILLAAEKVFDASGYAATTMEAVAAQAGISKGSIYNYFASKQELFTQVFFEHLGQPQPDLMRLLSEPMSASQRLQLLVDGWFERLAEHKRVSRLVLEFWAAAAREGRAGEIADKFGHLYAVWRGRLTEIIAAGQACGEFSGDFEPAVAAALIVAVVDGITVQTILDVGVTIDERFVQSLKRAIMTSLTARAAQTLPAGSQGQSVQGQKGIEEGK